MSIYTSSLYDSMLGAYAMPHHIGQPCNLVAACLVQQCDERELYQPPKHGVVRICSRQKKAEAWIVVFRELVPDIYPR